MNNFGKRLRQLRRERDITMIQLADYLGTTQPTISKYERGIHNPDLPMIRMIAQFFNVSTDYLIGKSDNRSIYEGEPSDLIRDLPEDEIITMAAHKLGMDPNHKLTDEERQKLKDIFRYVFNDLINNGK